MTATRMSKAAIGKKRRSVTEPFSQAVILGTRAALAERLHHVFSR
jgi:hypothetical protein